MKKMTSKMMYLFIAMFTLVTLSGCGVDATKPTKIQGGVWDEFFVKPVALLINFITDNTGSFAIGIVLTTIIVRTILFPIYTKTNDTSSKMQAIQPEIKSVQAKYAGKTDPESRQKMQMELMQVYKDNDVNMLAGCLMPFLQMPVFIAMYHAVSRTPATFTKTFGENGQETTQFLWTSLSDKDPFFILPIIVALTAIALQYVSMYGLSEEAKNNPTMKVMMYMMPAMMFVFSISQVAALSLYWIAGNIYSTLQIIFVKKPFKKDK